MSPQAMSAPMAPGGASTPSVMGSTPLMASAPTECASRTISAPFASMVPRYPGLSQYTAA